MIAACLYAKHLGVSTKCTDLCCRGAEEDSCKILPVVNMLMTFEHLFHVDSDISLAVSTRMPYCPILTFEDDSTYKHAKDKFSICRAIEVQWVFCRGFILISIS